MSENPIILKLKNLTIGYKNKPLVEDINTSLSKGQLIALIGKNGIGKSTLFKTVMGQLPSLGGEVLLNGKNISKLPTKERAKQMAVVLTQKPDVAGMKVIEMVKMGRHPYASTLGQLSEDDLNLVNQSIKDMGIEHLKDRFLYELSDGEYQKMMLARAMAQDTPLILMDEPSAFLDYPSKIDLIHNLKQLCRQGGKTIIFSTHEIPLIEKSVDLLWGISNHKLKAYDHQEISKQQWKDEILGLNQVQNE